MFLGKKGRPPNTENPTQRQTETCANPWNHKCKNTDIVVVIRFNGELLPICDKCWSEISASNKEW